MKLRMAGVAAATTVALAVGPATAAAQPNVRDVAKQVRSADAALDLAQQAAVKGNVGELLKALKQQQRASAKAERKAGRVSGERRERRATKKVAKHQDAKSAPSPVWSRKSRPRRSRRSLGRWKLSRASGMSSSLASSSSPNSCRHRRGGRYWASSFASSQAVSSTRSSRRSVATASPTGSRSSSVRCSLRSASGWDRRSTASRA